MRNVPQSSSLRSGNEIARINAVRDMVSPCPETSMLPTPPSKRRKGHWLWIIALLLVIAGSYLYWSKSRAAARTDPVNADRGGKKAGRGGGAAATPVVAARARRGSIGVYFTGLGAVTPINTVTVKSRVDGQLMNVFYQEGDLVQSGDRLIEI